MSINWLNHLGFKSLPQLVTLNPQFKTFFETFGAVQKVDRNHIPALRALIRKQFPNSSVHDRVRIETIAAETMGGKIGGYLNAADSMDTYANAINNASRDASIKDALSTFANLSQRQQVQGSQGYASEPFTEGKVGGKETLSTHFIQAGTENFDTPMAVKVASSVNGDFFNYWAANPEHGIYNGMFLNDAQWEKDVHYAGADVLPRSGDDQLYFPSFVLDERKENSQPVEAELEEKFETELYAIQAEHYQGWDFLKDKQDMVEPIMGIRRNSRFVPVQEFASFSMDMEQPLGAAFNNYVGFRPITDSFRNMEEPTRVNVEPTLSEDMSFKLVSQNGFMLPSYS